MLQDNVDPRFFSLVFTFHQSAMFALGKLPNPVTNKIERNLQQAKYAIDTLEMLTEKSKGNLSENEEKFLKNTLQELRLNYVYESNQEDKDKAADKDKVKEQQAASDKQESPAEKKEGKEDNKKSKKKKK